MRSLLPLFAARDKGEDDTSRNNYSAHWPILNIPEGIIQGREVISMQVFIDDVENSLFQVSVLQAAGGSCCIFI